MAKPKIGSPGTETAHPKKVFRVRSKGYLETFDDIEKARTQYATLKKRAVKEQSSTHVVLDERAKESDEWRVVEEVKIKDGFYQ